MLSVWRSFLKWRMTDPGRSVLNKLGAVVCSGGFAAYVLPQTFYLEKFKRWFQVHHGGVPLEIPEKLEFKGREVLEKTDLLQSRKDKIGFFHVCGFDVMHLGSTAVSSGAVVGLPKTYNYEDEDDIERHLIVIQDCTYIPWDEDVGDDLKTALVLSEDAQKFAIAREIFNVTYPTPYIYGGLASGSMLFAQSLSQMGNQRLKLLKHPFHIRAIWYTLCSAFAWLFWVSIKDTVTVYIDGQCDKFATDLGKEFVKGGVEYYEKRMLLNRSLRTLMKSRGEHCFTAHGNFRSSFRTESMPLSQRLDQMKKLWSELETDK